MVYYYNFKTAVSIVKGPFGFSNIIWDLSVLCCSNIINIHERHWINANFTYTVGSVLWASGVWVVQVGAVDVPIGREVLSCVALDVSLHSDQAIAELQAHCALVGRGPAVGPQVLDHGRVVSWALTTETTLKGFLSLKREGGGGGTHRKEDNGRENS